MNTSLVSYVNLKNLKIAKEQADRDKFLKVLNQNPPSKWVKVHPIANIEYIPIEIIENTMTMLFQDWHVEVLQVQQILNSVAVTVRVHYRDPLSREMRFQDGVGAVPAQSEKGTALSISTIRANAIQIGLPAAKSFAIKDAVEHIGKLFGRDIGRKNALDFTPRYIEGGDNLKSPEDARIRQFIANSTTSEQLTSIEGQLIAEGVHTSEYGILIAEKLKEIDRVS
jgi:hypothetical protein